MIARLIGLIGVVLLIGCDSSGTNPVTGGPNSDDTPDTTTDPNTQSANTTFLFDPARFLTANQFTFTPGATPGTGTIQINNLPFDNVSSQGGAYTPTAGVVLPNGEVYDNATAGGDAYLAVVLQSPTGSGALIGAVGTNVYSGFGYGGAYASRPSAGLPPTRTAAYVYNGQYNGIRVVRQTGGPNNAIQLVTGNASVQVDLQDFDLTGAIRGFITGRQLFAADGTPLGALTGLELVISDIDNATLTTTNGTTRTVNADGTDAQTGTWEGLFSGPNGEEIVGLVIVEGNLPDTDPNFAGAGAPNPTTGREVGGFIVQR